MEEDLLGLEQGRKGTESQRDAAGQAAAVGSKSFSLGWGIGEGSWPVKLNESPLSLSGQLLRSVPL